MPLDPIEIIGGLAIGEGLGGAIADTVEPRLQTFKNDQWSKHQDVPLAAETAAEVAAEEVDQYDLMQTQASYSGYDADRFADLYRVTLTAPGVGTLINLLRREDEKPIDFAHGLRKAKLADQWDAALTNLASERLTPQQIALGIVRSVIADPGLLATTLDLSGGVVPAYPVWPGDALAEAKTGGIDKDRLRVMVGEIGLPMSAQQAASAFFRGIIEHGDFNRAILEGDTRPEWAPYILAQARQILTAGEYSELQLRGYYDRATRLANTRKHGMSDEDSDLLYDVQGRGLNLHAAFVSERRGGVFKGPVDTIPDWALYQLQRGNLRPEVYNMAWAGRETYPSAFVVRALATDGAISPERTLSLFLGLGWPEDVAVSAAKHYAPKATAAVDADLKKAHTKAWTQAQSSYIAEEATASDVQPIFDLLGVATTTQPEIIATWDAIRALIRKQLSPKEIVKAVQGGVINPATGVAWTLADGIAALLARGYTQADAETLLAE